MEVHTAVAEAAASAPQYETVDPHLASALADAAVICRAPLLAVIEQATDQSAARVTVTTPDSTSCWTAPAEDVAGILDTRTSGRDVVPLDRLRALEVIPGLPPATRVLVTAPLGDPDDRLGCLIVGFNFSRRLDPARRRLAAAAGRQVGLATRHHREIGVLREQAEESRILLELAQLPTSTWELDRIMDRFIARAVELTSADKGSIWRLSDDGQDLIPTALAGMPAEFVTRWKAQRFARRDQPLSAEALRTRKPVAIPDAAEDPRTDKIALQMFGERALLVVPIISGGQALGTLFLNNVYPRERHTPREIEIAQLIASQAGAAMRLSGLFDTSERGRRDMESALRQFGDILAAGSDPAAAIESIASLAEQMMTADGAAIYRARNGILTRVAATGALTSMAVEAPETSGRLGEVLTERLPLRLDASREIAADLGLVVAATAPDFSYIAVPLLVGDKSLGVLVVIRSTAPFIDREADVLRAFARGAGVAMQRSDMLDALERRVVELSSLQRAAHTLTSLSSLRQTLDNVVEGVHALTGSGHCAVLLVNPDRGGLEVYNDPIGVDRAFVAHLARTSGPDSLAMRAIHADEPLVFNDLVDPSPPDLADGIASHERNLLLAPMKDGDEAVGLIRVANRPEGFTVDDVRVISIFADQAASVVRNVVLFQAQTRERDQLDAIFGSASDGIVIADAHARVVRLNRAAEVMLGWDEVTAERRPVSEVLALQDAEGRSLTTTHPLEWVHLQRSPIAYREQWVKTRDDRTVEIAASYAFVPGPAGAELAVAILRDLSAARQVERLKSDFVSFVSHELRTPLSLIKGYASTLLRPGLALPGDTQNRFLQGISDASDRLAAIVNNLLNVSRIESGLFVPRLRVADLRDVVAPVVQEMKAHAAGRISLVALDHEAVVLVDQEQLRLVVSNVIGNAIRHAIAHSDDPIVVILRAENDGYVIEVSDSGPGISEEDLPHIFEKFYRGSGEDQPTVPGSGLGLYICQNIVEAHNGRIWAHSPKGGGATIGFWLPARHMDCEIIDRDGG